MQTQGACDGKTLQKKRHMGRGRMRQLNFKEGRVRKGGAENGNLPKRRASVRIERPRDGWRGAYGRWRWSK